MISSSTQTNCNGPRLFDLESKTDDQELMAWCRIHWQHTIDKGIQGGNSPIYHDCCISFTKKGCVKRLSHPSLQSASVLKIPSLRHATSPDTLYYWLRDRLAMHERLGKKLYFPSINVAHFHSEDDESDNLYDAVRMLNKRNDELAEEIVELERQLKASKEENRKMQGAVKSWFSKYDELIGTAYDGKPSHKEATPSYAEITPKKKLKTETPEEDLFKFS